ncbi:hypothetical protein E3P99_03120 [Wallemia hederae]|uniref:Prokaryotic-type class I peptide chain release factors domain-containing protein n=1 Tax=Wallemia hederae TaxID=1540922 RepID=A0A4T0FJ01_9BASI|nr:hypothetical protein E3P99_03120 [Wallemia hederae]
MTLSWLARRWYSSGSRNLPLDVQTQAIAKSWISRLSELKIPSESVQVTYARSSGSGGQHVNKTSSKAVVRMSAVQKWLPEYVQQALRRDSHYVKSSDSIIVADSSTRSASQNARAAQQRIADIIRSVSMHGVVHDTHAHTARRVGEHKRNEKKNTEKHKRMHKEKKALRRNDKE